MQVSDDYIDELFACKLGNMEVTPPEDGWFRLENELNRRSGMKQKYWLAAASFALVLSVTASVVYMQTKFFADSNDGDIQPVVVLNEQMQTVEEPLSLISEPQLSVIAETQPTIEEQLITTTETQPLTEEIQLTIAETQPTIEDPLPIISDPQPTIEDSQLTTAETQLLTEKNQPTIAEIQPLAEEIQPTIAETQPLTEEPQPTSAEPQPTIEYPLPVISEPQPTTADYLQIILDLQSNSYTFNNMSPEVGLSLRKRWEVSGHFAPLQSYRSISSVPAGLRKSDFDDAESPLLAYSGGITLSFSIFKRLSIQTGAFYTQMGQSINNVTPVTNMHAAVSSNNSYTKNFVRTSSGSVTVASNVKADVNSTYSHFFNSDMQYSNISPTSSHTATYQLIERVDYLEIPLMLRYKVINRKFGLSVLSGMSANVLLDTNVFVDTGEEILKSGTILMARPVNYSSTFGLGISYQFMKNISIGMEPVFKYYLHSYTTNSQVGSNPYAFGLFTGAVYRF